LPGSGSTDDERAPALEQALMADAAPCAAEFPSHPDAKTMDANDVAYLPEQPAHDLEIDLINEEAFGPGRFARAAYHIREGGPHEGALSFVAVHEGAVVGSVRMTRVAAGEGRALLLGPLAVRPDYKNIGIGRRLVRIALGAAAKYGAPAVLLVGDEPYYGPLGFRKIRRGQIIMPRPVDPHRLLAVELVPGAVAKLSGMLDHEDRAKVEGWEKVPAGG
jgi:predicted N-acetyltransferase YhbS